MPKPTIYDSILIEQEVTSEDLLARTLRLLSLSVTALEAELRSIPEGGMHEATSRKVRDAATSMEKLMTLQLRLEKQSRDKVKKMSVADKVKASLAFLSSLELDTMGAAIDELGTKYRRAMASRKKGTRVEVVTPEMERDLQ